MKQYVAAQMQMEQFDEMDVITASSEPGDTEEDPYFDYTTPWA